MSRINAGSSSHSSGQSRGVNPSNQKRNPPTSSPHGTALSSVLESKDENSKALTSSSSLTKSSSLKETSATAYLHNTGYASSTGSLTPRVNSSDLDDLEANTGATPTSIPDTREIEEAVANLRQTEPGAPPSLIPEARAIEKAIENVNKAFKSSLQSSLTEALAPIDEAILLNAPANDKDSTDPRTSISQLAESFTKGAFNQISNNAMIGNHYSTDYIPQAMLKQEEGSQKVRIDTEQLATFHGNMMDKLLTRLSGIDMKLRLQSQGMQNINDKAFDISNLQRHRLRHFGRCLVTSASNRANSLVLGRLRTTVLHQIKNESLRAGHKAFETMKIQMRKLYGEQSDAAKIFENQSALAQPMSADTGTLKTVWQNIKTAVQPGTLKRQLINVTPNMREGLVRAWHSAKTGHLAKGLGKMGKIETLQKPVEQGLISSALAAHKMLYGFSTKSLDQHVKDAGFNRQLTRKLHEELQPLEVSLEAESKKLKEIQERPKPTTRPEKATHNKQLKTAKNAVSDLDYKVNLMTLRANRAERAYQASAKEIVRYISPSKFEKDVAEKGFHHSNNHRSSPNNFLSGLASSTASPRSQLMHDTNDRIFQLQQHKAAIKVEIQGQLKFEGVNKKRVKLADVDAIKNAEINDQLNEKIKNHHTAKTQIKINAVLIHAPKDPLQALRKTVDLLATSDEDKKLTQEIDAVKKAFSKNNGVNPKFQSRLNDLVTKIDTLLNNATDKAAITSKQNEQLRNIFQTDGQANTGPLKLDDLFKGIAKTRLIDLQKKDAIADYKAAFGTLNQLMTKFINPEKNKPANNGATKNEASDERQQLSDKIKEQVTLLMRTSDIGDELTGTYNTLVASLNNIIGDPDTTVEGQRTQNLRAKIPPMATAIGGMLLESAKTEHTALMADNFVKLLECLSEDITQTSLFNRNKVTGNKAQPQTVQDLLKNRALMTNKAAMDHVADTFDHARAGLSGKPPEKAITNAVAALSKKVKDLFAKDQSPGKTDIAEMKEKLTGLYKELYKELSKQDSISIKPNQKFWTPWSTSNERSIHHHVNILVEAIQELAKLKQDGKTGAVIDPNVVTNTMLSFMDSDLQHHFRRSDLDMSSMRDRMLWGQESPASIASSTLIATALNDKNEKGAARDVDDPQSILGTLQRDFSRTVNMPSQVITQGVVNAALVGSAFGSVPAMLINPMLMFTPTPLPFLNGGDFISMSTFSAGAAVPLSILAAIKSRHNHQTLNKADQQLLQDIYLNGGKKPDQPKTAKPSEMETMPKQFANRNSVNLEIIKGLYKAKNAVMGTVSQPAGHYAVSGQPYDVSGKKQALRILNETRKSIGENILAQTALSVISGVQLTGKMFKNDFDVGQQNEDIKNHIAQFNQFDMRAKTE